MFVGTGGLRWGTWTVLQGASLGFDSTHITLAELVDETFELIPNVDVNPLIVNVR